jgi:hypothetical protein
MGNRQLTVGRFIGQEVSGETRPMRNPLIPEGKGLEGLVKDFRGMNTLKEIFE